MDSQQFAKLSKATKVKISKYITDQAPGMVIRKTLRFIDGNFRAGGWQGNSFNKWYTNARGTSNRVKTGAMRRSFNYSGAGAGAVRFYSNVPYAYAHNRGFRGTINIKAHTRAKYQSSKVMAINEFTRNGRRKTKTITNKIGETMVKAHTRKVNIIQSQFAPYEGSESRILNESISRELNREITKILTIK